MQFLANVKEKRCLKTAAKSHPLVHTWQKLRACYPSSTWSFPQASPSPPQLHHSPPVQPAVGISNHQHPRLSPPMSQHQSQPCRIGCHLENRLTYHQISRWHPRSQSHPVHTRRFLPSPALPINQISPYQSLTLRLFPFIRHPHRHPHQPAPISNQKSRHLLHSSNGKTHVIETLRLPHRHHSLPLHQRNSNQHAKIDHPHPDQPRDAPPHLLPLTTPRRHPHSQHADRRPPHQPQQQKLRPLHPRPIHDRL